MGVLTQPAFHSTPLYDLWACLPNQHSTTWHACLICVYGYPNWHACLIHGHAYPTGTPPPGILVSSVGMLTPPALHYIACLPDLWACVPNRQPAFSHMACLPDLWACLSTWHSGMLARSVGMLTYLALHPVACLHGHAYPSCPQA